MNILGISAFFHDSAAALVADGQIVAAAQEERFSRRKHDDRNPAQAIAYCLGTPLRNELEQRDPTRLDEATKHATTRLRERFGPTDLDSKIRGFVITATAP